jgi:flagellar export protein FliJ
MKRFKFSMLGVLSVNQARYDVCKMELIAAQNILNKEREKEQHLSEQLEHSMLIDWNANYISANTLIQREKYIKLIRDHLSQQRFKIMEEQAKVDSARQRLTLALLEVKKLEKLQEREKNNWNIEYNHEEQRIGDDIGTARAFYNNLS